MYYEEAIFKRQIKEGQNTLRNGTIKKTRSERVSIKGLSKKSNFEDNEEIIIMRKKDFIEVEEARKHIKELEATITDLEEDNLYLRKQDTINNVPAGLKEGQEDLIYNLMLNNAVEEAIKIISSRYKAHIKKANEQNIKEAENIIKNLKYDIEKQNNKLRELQIKALTVISGLDNQIATFNKEISQTSRFKILLHKNKINLSLDNSEILEHMEALNKIESVNIAGSYYFDKVFNIPGLDLSEVKEAIETELKNNNLKDFNKEDNNIIDV